MLPGHRRLAFLIGLALLLVGASGAEGQQPARVDLRGDPLPPGAVTRLGSARLRHAGNVWWVAFADGGKALLSAGEDGLVRVWETATGRELRRFPWTGYGDSLALSADGKLLATVTDEFAVNVWEVGPGKRRHRFEGKPLAFGLAGQPPICGVALTPDGRTLAAWWTDAAGRGVRLWDLAAGKELPSLSPPRGKIGSARWHNLALSPDGKLLAASEDQYAAVHVWQTASGKPLRTLEQVDAWYRGRFSPDGKTLALEVLAAAPFGLWDVATGKRLPAPADAAGMWYSVVFSPDSKTVAAIDGRGNNYAVQWWDTATGKKLHRQAFGEHAPASFLTFSPDGRLLAAADERHEVRVWETATGKLASRFLIPRTGTSPVCRVAFSPDGRTLACTGGGNLVRRFDLPSGKEVAPPAGLRCPPADLALSPDGKTLAALGTDQSAQLWEVATGKGLRAFPPLAQPADVINIATPPALVFLPGEDVPTVVWNGSAFVLQNIAQPLKQRRFEGLGYLSSYAFFNDGKSLVMGNFHGLVRVWDTATGKERRRFVWPLEKDERGQPLLSMSLRVAVSADGGTIAAAGVAPGAQPNSQRTTLRLWEMASAQERLTLRFRPWAFGSPRGGFTPGDPDTISALAFSADGAALALGHGETIRLWDAARNKELRRFGGAGVKAETAVFSPDGRLLAARSEGGGLQLWDVATGTALPPVGGRHLAVTCFLFSRDGRVLFTGCQDTTVLAWDVARLADAGRKSARTAAELESLWRDLASGDAGRAYRAAAEMAASPAAAVRFVSERLPPLKAADVEQTARLLAALDSKQFAAREKAARELESLGHLAAPAIHKALASGPSLETRRRLEQLVEKLQGPFTSPELLRRLRAIALLERLGSAEATRVLQRLAAGAAHHPGTEAAQAALQRLQRCSAAAR